MKKLISLVFAAALCANAYATGVVATATATNVTCNGACNGTATAMASGGVGPYGFAWTGPSFTSSGAGITGLCPGTYIVTATDSSDMSTATYTLSVVQPPPVAIAVTGTAGMCLGDSTILTTYTTGGSAGAYMYAWTPAAGLSATNVAAPTCTLTSNMSYTVTTTDGNGCTASTTVTVNVHAPFTVTASSNSPVCENTPLNVSASAIAGATYAWYAPAAYTSTLQNPTFAYADPVINGPFVVIATYGGCSVSDTTNVLVMSVQSTVTSTPESSCGACDGTATIMTTGGTAPYSYDWGTGATGAGTISGLCPGSYTVVTTDPNGCTDTSLTYVSSPQPDANFSIVPDSANGYSILAFNTSALASNYYWDFGDGNVSTSASPTHTYAAAGTYTICLQAVGAGSCGDTVCRNVTITGTPASCLALFNIADDTTSSSPNNYTIYNLSYGASLTYLWDFGDGTTSVLANPTHVYAAPGPFRICLTVDNGSGCVQSYCDSVFSADSLGRTSDAIHIVVVDGTPGAVITGITGQSMKASVSVSPNPFNDNTTFVITNDLQNIAYTFEMTDVLGKKVIGLSSISGKEFSISRNGLDNGIYFYKIYSASGITGTGKLIIK